MHDQFNGYSYRTLKYGVCEKLPTYSRDGYSFLGWSNISGGTANYSPGYNFCNSVTSTPGRTLYGVWATNFIDSAETGFTRYISPHSLPSISSGSLIVAPSETFKFSFSKVGNVKLTINAMSTGTFKIYSGSSSLIESGAAGNYKDYIMSLSDSNVVTITNTGNSGLYIKSISVTPNTTTSARVVEEPTLMDLVMNIKVFIRDAWYSTVEKLRKLFN